MQTEIIGKSYILEKTERLKTFVFHCHSFSQVGTILKALSFTASLCLITRKIADIVSPNVRTEKE